MAILKNMGEVMVAHGRIYRVICFLGVLRPENRFILALYSLTTSSASL